MKTIQLFFAAVFAMLLVGCGSQPVDRMVPKTQHVVVTPEARYLKTTPVPAVAPVKQYQEGEIVDWEKEYRELAARTVEVYKGLGMCNADKAAAIIDINQKKKRYE